MRLTLNDGHCIALSATRCYCPSDLQSSLAKYVQTNTTRTLLVDFAGEYVPVKSDDQLRMVCMLACAYHNHLVRSNIQDPTYDTYKAPPDVGAWQTAKPKRRARRVRAMTPEPPRPPEEWDEELLGERLVFDDKYEMNEDLVPWKQERRNDWNIERWGLYA